MRFHALVLTAILVAPAVAGAQAPRYTPEFLGTALPVRMNESGVLIGRATEAGNERGAVLRSGQPVHLLPLPAGMISSYAKDINELGVVVGQVGPLYSPDFSGRAAAWYPDGHGGYSVVLLGVLPGHVISAATAVNNLGDIVGYSGDGTFRRAVHFRAPGDLVDLTSLGIFDPVEINDQRVLVDNSSTAKRLDLDTMVAQDLGIPAPPGGSHYRATWSMAINEWGQVAGAAILTTSTSCDRQATRYRDGVGWEVFSMCGPNNSALDLNDRGDIVMCITISPYVRFEGGGTFLVNDLIVNDVGVWYAISGSLGAINNQRQIVIYAANSVTGEAGALLLTPESGLLTTVPAGSDIAGAGTRLAISADPNPFHPGTTLQYRLTAGETVDLTVYDAAGRRVRQLLAGVRQEAGLHEFGWDGRDDHGGQIASGVYFCVLQAGGDLTSTRLVMAR